MMERGFLGMLLLLPSCGVGRGFEGRVEGEEMVGECSLAFPVVSLMLGVEIWEQWFDLMSVML